jgi:hypothetical protein
MRLVDASFLVSSFPRVGAASEATMDWETLYCPNRCCRLYGLPWRQSALVKHGASRSYKQALCRACGQIISLRYGTVYFELEADPVILTPPFAPWPRKIPYAGRPGSFKSIRIPIESQAKRVNDNGCVVNLFTSVWLPVLLASQADLAVQAPSNHGSGANRSVVPSTNARRCLCGATIAR